MEFDNRQPESFLALPRITKDLTELGFSVLRMNNYTEYFYDKNGVHSELRVGADGTLTNIMQHFINGRYCSYNHIASTDLIAQNPSKLGYYFSTALTTGKIRGSQSGDECESQAYDVEKLSPVLARLSLITNRSRKAGKMVDILDLSLINEFGAEARIAFDYDGKDIVLNYEESNPIAEEFLAGIEVDFVNRAKDQQGGKVNEHICRLYCGESDMEAILTVVPAIATLRNEEELIEVVQSGRLLFKTSAVVKPGFTEIRP